MNRQTFNWTEYLLEALGLGIFMASAGLFGTLLGDPASPLAGYLSSPLLSRGVMGLLMGLTAAGIIYSPIGLRSGAHLNPAVTLTFWCLGRIKTVDAVFYAISQVIGGLAGVLIILSIFQSHFSDPPVLFVATLPGSSGALAAFGAELAISFILMSTVLRLSNSPRFSRFTGLAAAALVALFIIVESPLSGMSMNPARSFASAFPGGLWSGFWIYLSAGPIGMILAGVFYRLTGREVFCAKLVHGSRARCIFFCRHAELIHQQKEI